MTLRARLGTKLAGFALRATLSLACRQRDEVCVLFEEVRPGSSSASTVARAVLRQDV